MSVTHKFSVAGIGASAGGLEALRALLGALEPTGEVAFVIAQHMSPQHRSMLVELLAKDCYLSVVEAEDGEPIKPDYVYVNPPNKDIKVINETIRLQELEREVGPKPSIDTLMFSMAEDLGERAVGIILSGTGSDGARGCRAIRAAGGITIAQDPESAKYDGMPNSAIRADAIDLVLTAEQIAVQLQRIIAAPRRNLEVTGDAGVDTVASLSELINRIYKETHIDFSQYKESTLGRQVQRRIAALGLANLEEYFDYLEGQPHEIEVLQRSFLISVTHFFRDPESFEKLGIELRDAVLKKAARSSVRIWVPACATGEEAYSIAISLIEHLGVKTADYDIKIFGTDIDNNATEVARKGVYPEAALVGIPKELVDRYFTQEGRDYKISKHVRDLCIFARQNLVSDPPFLRMDMISCRNLLIYFTSELQDHVIKNFHYSLMQGGLLFLGKSETVGQACAPLFINMDKGAKLFKKRNVAGRPPQLATRPSAREMRAAAVVPARQSKLDAMNRCLLDAYGPPSVMINGAGEPVQFFGEIARFLNLPQGAAEFNLISLAPQSVRTELRALIYRAFNSRKSYQEHITLLQGDEASIRVRIAVRRLAVREQEEDLFLVSFEELGKLETSGKAAIETEYTEQTRVRELEDELNSNREHLQAVIEELETSNEELQSLNEELQASTEELQSSNEELETSNEELEATNEELTTLNDELQAKSQELTTANVTLNNIQNSINLGFIVVDKSLRILRYTPKVVRIFNLLPEDKGQSIVGIPSHLNLPNLEANIQHVLEKGSNKSVEVTHQNETYLLTLTPFIDENGEIDGVILAFNDITELSVIRKTVRETERKFKTITESLQEIVWMSSENFDRFKYLSPTFSEYIGYSISTSGFSTSIYREAIHEADRERFLEAIKAEKWDVEYRLVHTTGRVIWVRDRGKVLQDSEPGVKLRIGSAVDITTERDAIRKLTFSEEKFRGIFDYSTVGIVLLDEKRRICDANNFFKSWLGYTLAEIQGRSIDEFLAASELELSHEQFDELLKGSRVNYKREKQFLTKSGQSVYGLVSVSRAQTPEDPYTDQQFIQVIQDISGEKRARERVYQQANYDSLTNLPNRNLLHDRLAQSLKHAKRADEHLYLLFIDLDSFKEINDTEGHIVGDRVLAKIANRFGHQLRSEDVLSRFGGDEFVVVLHSESGLEGVQTVIEKLLEAAREEILIGEQMFHLSASIGIACYPSDAEDEQALVQYADTAMYAAKAEGGNDCRFFSRDMNELANSRRGVKYDLLRAIEHDEFELNFQPLVDPCNDQVTGAEVLIRWNHPDRGYLLPSEFIPIAEETYLIEQIDLWVLRKVSELLTQRGEELRHLSVNLTARTVRTSAFEQWAQAHQKILSMLTFEMTEGAFYRDLDHLNTVLADVRSRGARVSLDDFGTGYSNLSRIGNLPVDQIKIDKTFTDLIVQRRTRVPVIDAIFNIAEQFKIGVVAEGVETDIQHSYLTKKRGVVIQGFFYAQPMLLESYIEFCQRYPSTPTAD